MKAADLKTKTPDQLVDDLNALRKEQFNFRFQRSTGQLENTSRVRAVRRDIARIKTMMTEKKKAAVAVVKVKKAPVAKKTAAKKVKGE